MLDEEEKSAALSDKKKSMWVHYCFRSRKSEGLYGRNSAGAIFAHSKSGKYLETHLGIPEDKQLPGTLCLVPHVIMSDKAFPLKTYLLKPYPGSQSKEDNEKSTFNYMLSRSRRVLENAFGILSHKFQIFSEDPTIIAGEYGQNYFCDLYFAQLSERSRCRPK